MIKEVKMTDKITRFEDMPVWKQSQSLAVNIYKLTKDFPNSEIYALTSQIRRASSSVSANIAEGFGRKTAKDKANFYHIAYGSLLETKNFIYLAEKLGYLKESDSKDAIKQVESVQNQITEILKYFKKND